MVSAHLFIAEVSRKYNDIMEMPEYITTERRNFMVHPNISNMPRDNYMYAITK